MGYWPRRGGHIPDVVIVSMADMATDRRQWCVDLRIAHLGCCEARPWCCICCTPDIVWPVLDAVGNFWGSVDPLRHLGRLLSVAFDTRMSTGSSKAQIPGTMSYVHFNEAQSRLWRNLHVADILLGASSRQRLGQLLFCFLFSAMACGELALNFW